jgi:hypothetical protein
MFLMEMLRNARIRRPLAIILIALGLLLMLLTPPVWPWMWLLVLGVAIEFLGIVLRHMDARAGK